MGPKFPPTWLHKVWGPANDKESGQETPHVASAFKPFPRVSWGGGETRGLGPRKGRTRQSGSHPVPARQLGTPAPPSLGLPPCPVFRGRDFQLPRSSPTDVCRPPAVHLKGSWFPPRHLGHKELPAARHLPSTRKVCACLCVPNSLRGRGGFRQ